jgi:hypothetical protein
MGWILISKSWVSIRRNCFVSHVFRLTEILKSKPSARRPEMWIRTPGKPENWAFRLADSLKNIVSYVDHSTMTQICEARRTRVQSIHDPSFIWACPPKKPAYPPKPNLIFILLLHRDSPRGCRHHQISARNSRSQRADQIYLWSVLRNTVDLNILTIRGRLLLLKK